MTTLLKNKYSYLRLKALAAAWLNKLLAMKELNILAVILADS